MNINTCNNLNNLIKSNTNIELIEIWSNILYLRMKSGRNKFYSKKDITTESSGIFINWGLNKKKTYYSLQKKYHPDLNSKHKYLSQQINEWYEWIQDNEDKFNNLENLVKFNHPNQDIFTCPMYEDDTQWYASDEYQDYAAVKQWEEYQKKTPEEKEEREREKQRARDEKAAWKLFLQDNEDYLKTRIKDVYKTLKKLGAQMQKEKEEAYGDLPIWTEDWTSLKPERCTIKKRPEVFNILAKWLIYKKELVYNKENYLEKV